MESISGYGLDGGMCIGGNLTDCIVGLCILNGTFGQFCGEPVASDPNLWFKGVDLRTDLLYDPNETCGEKHSPLENDVSPCAVNSTCCDYTDPLSLLAVCSPVHKCAHTSSLKDRDMAFDEHPLFLGIFVPVIWALSLVAVVGNVVVISHCVYSLKRFSLSKAEKSYKIMILNLSFADLLMGVYLSCIVFNVVSDFGDYDNTERQMWLQSVQCTALGIMNFSSSQISVTALVTITTVRLFSVYRPYNDVKPRVIFGVAVGTWIFWVAAACIPILSIDAIANTFQQYIVIASDIQNESFIFHFHEIGYITTQVLDNINDACNFTDNQNNYSLPDDFRSWKTLITVAKKLNILKMKGNENMDYLGYYNTQSVCSITYVIESDDYAAIFTFIVVMFDLISFAFILLAQIAIARKSSTKVTFLASCARFMRKRDSDESPKPDRREMENRRMYRQMFLIVFTNFCCWIPVSVISLRYFAISYADVPDVCHFLKRLVTYNVLFTMIFIILIPANSAINPFLYSTRFWKVIWKKLKNRCAKNPPYDGTARVHSVNTRSEGTIDQYVSQLTNNSCFESNRAPRQEINSITTSAL